MPQGFVMTYPYGYLPFTVTLCQFGGKKIGMLVCMINRYHKCLAPLLSDIFLMLPFISTLFYTFTHYSVNDITLCAV